MNLFDRVLKVKKLNTIQYKILEVSILYIVYKTIQHYIFNEVRIRLGKYFAKNSNKFGNTFWVCSMSTKPNLNILKNIPVRLSSFIPSKSLGYVVLSFKYLHSRYVTLEIIIYALRQRP